LTLGYSPCPNDTFIFAAIADGRVAAGGERPAPFLADVEVLNRKARGGELDVTKISCHALLHCLDRYWMLRAGGALGRGCGPLIVAREPVSIDALSDKSIAIPGRLTTAHLLLQLLGSHHGRRPELPFEQIMPAVAAGRVAAGLVIHEGRFTYRAHGLHLVMDLGAWWEARTGLPLPLGCIVIRRELGRGGRSRRSGDPRQSAGGPRRPARSLAVHQGSCPGTGRHRDPAPYRHLRQRLQPGPGDGRRAGAACCSGNRRGPGKNCAAGWRDLLG